MKNILAVLSLCFVYVYSCMYHCEELFDVYKYSICDNSNMTLEKNITYYNLYQYLDYKNYNECVLNNELILFIRYLDYKKMSSFWIITS